MVRCVVMRCVVQDNLAAERGGDEGGEQAASGKVRSSWSWEVAVAAACTTSIGVLVLIDREGKRRQGARWGAETGNEGGGRRQKNHGPHVVVAFEASVYVLAGSPVPYTRFEPVFARAFSGYAPDGFRGDLFLRVCFARWEKAKKAREDKAKEEKEKKAAEAKAAASLGESMWGGSIEKEEEVGNKRKSWRRETGGRLLGLRAQKGYPEETEGGRYCVLVGLFCSAFCNCC